MDSYQDQLVQERNYLEKIKGLISKRMLNAYEKLDNKRRILRADQKDMYENTTHYSHDFEKLSDAIAYLNPIEVQTYDYAATNAEIRKLERMQKAPYFARIEFTEEGFDKESIYIGLGNLADEKTHQTYICDWRAPVSSIFYRFGLGRASYKAPYGIIEGEVSLKRQYEIKNNELQYFFDSSVTIIDDILKQALSQNSSAKMKSIVETIQNEQDIIIRDIENDLLIVQGVAGSGKTSVALHRVAYLMYHGLTENLSSNNIIIITPNNLFEKYIENVLPELGEENIQAMTMEELFESIFEEKIHIGRRTDLMEQIITLKDSNTKQLLRSCMEFVLSKDFITIIDRCIDYFEHKMIDFKDIFYNGECIANRHLLKAELLRQNDISLPLERRLEAIEKRIMKKIHEQRKKRIQKLEKFIAEFPEHIYEVRTLARLLSLKENKAINKEVTSFTRIDAMDLFKKLAGDRDLFYRLAKGLRLPADIDNLLNHINTDLKRSEVNYANGIALLMIKLKLTGCDNFKEIMQVVIDEAQDYYPVHYEIFKIVFRNAKFTVMGDINQTIEKNTDMSSYEAIMKILNKSRSSTVVMNKSFRCSYEINRFSSYFCNQEIKLQSFERHEKVPEVIQACSQKQMDIDIIEKIKMYKREGFQSIALICKSMGEAEQLYISIGKQLDAALINNNSFEAVNKVTILPVYMAKGLEFDAVLVYNVSDENYKNKEDRQLLYICCTRALHRLSLFYTGQRSRLIPSAGDAFNDVLYKDDKQLIDKF